MSNTRVCYTFAVVIVASLLLGCQSEEDNGGMAGQGQGGSSGAGGLGPGCTRDSDCDDGLSCTVDSCASLKCHHSIGPGSGPTACPTGQVCTIEKGCVDGLVCAEDEDCQKAFAGEPCKANVRCDPKTAVCLSDVLDKDGDGHPPQVCGGDDCDDSNSAIHPLQSEVCDGVDSNCNGMIDDEAVCPENEMCSGGNCTCKPENSCNQVCINTKTSTVHCGSCWNTCDPGESCENGECVCSPPSSQCGGECADLLTDADHCGACDQPCAKPMQCIDGTCECAWGDLVCGGTCVDSQTDDANCGACGKACPPDAHCTQAKCMCDSGLTDCGDKCVNTSDDLNHCGGCNHPCDAAGQQCVSGLCSCPWDSPTVCDHLCVNTMSDRDNCGACGTKCDAPLLCVNAQCEMACGGAGKMFDLPCNVCLKDECCSASEACMSNSMCKQLFFCVIACPITGGVYDQGCVQACASQFPVTPEYNPLIGCLGSKCQSHCPI